MISRCCSKRSLPLSWISKKRAGTAGYAPAVSTRTFQPGDRKVPQPTIIACLLACLLADRLYPLLHKNQVQFCEFFIAYTFIRRHHSMAFRQFQWVWNKRYFWWNKRSLTRVFVEKTGRKQGAFPKCEATGKQCLCPHRQRKLLIPRRRESAVFLACWEVSQALSSAQAPYRSLPAYAESSFAPLRLLSPRKPLRWACAGTPMCLAAQLRDLFQIADWSG